ncbi:MAG: tricarballylate dehydrogenase [Pelotomaculum sp. PtaB.Bin104]|nr:MAG: tricarballylate dehydrogenase [Pelotomaculum sp. PtaB.Bin104]
MYTNKIDENITADVLVIGGGPAGMLASASASAAGSKVILLEKNGQLGRKMGISGGGRGNLTNTASIHNFINNIPGNGKYLFSALNRFSNMDFLELLKTLGVPTKEEEYGRVFPAQFRATEVVRILKDFLEASGVKLYYQVSADKLLLDSRQCKGVRTAEGNILHSQAVVIATGGASYPHTGSTGDGYRLARQAGHQITSLLPGLVPLCCAGSITKQLQGLSINNVGLKLTTAEGKAIANEQGDIVFTHFGISGPAALKLSRIVSKNIAAGAGNLSLQLDVIPKLSKDQLTGKLLNLAGQQPKKAIANIIKQLLPDRLATVCMQMLPADYNAKSGTASKSFWRKIARLTKNVPFTITGTRPLTEAMITVGGVNIKEIDPHTMASRLVDGLYFAGEVIDVDAYTGGYNMQIAFSTGWLAGLSAVKKIQFTIHSKKMSL